MLRQIVSLTVETNAITGTYGLMLYAKSVYDLVSILAAVAILGVILWKAFPVSDYTRE